MPGYLDEWKNAKEKFETATGLKKPAAKGKALFISWRKGSGLETAFKKLDSHMASVRLLDEGDAGFYKKWKQYVDDMQKAKDKYLTILDDAIKQEKDKQGKSDAYRAFKVLKSSLDVVATGAEQKYEDYFSTWQLKREKGGQLLDSFDAALKTLKNLGTNLKSATAKATKFSKELLADPSPQKYNSGIMTAARDLSQSMSNIKKYVYADVADLWLKDNKAAQKTLDILDDDRVAKHLQKMSIALYGMERDIDALATKSGSTPRDASLAMLGNSPPRFPDDATANDVKDAVKNFAGHIKKCIEVSNQLLKFAR